MMLYLFIYRDEYKNSLTEKWSDEVRKRLNAVRGRAGWGGGGGWWLLEVYFPCSRELCGDSQTFPALATENNPQENRLTCCTSMHHSNSMPLAQRPTFTLLQIQTTNVTCATCRTQRFPHWSYGSPETAWWQQLLYSRSGPRPTATLRLFPSQTQAAIVHGNDIKTFFSSWHTAPVTVGSL